MCVGSFFSFTCTYSTALKYSWPKLDPCCARGASFLVEGKEEGEVLHGVKLFPWQSSSVGKWGPRPQSPSKVPLSHRVSWDVRVCLVLHFRMKKKITNSYEHLQVTWESQGGSRPRAVHQPTFAPLEIGLHSGRSLLNSWLSANPWISESLGIFCTNQHVADLLLQRSCPEPSQAGAFSVSREEKGNNSLESSVSLCPAGSWENMFWGGDSRALGLCLHCMAIKEG